MLDLEKITLKVREIALRAGAFLRKERSGFDRSKVEKKNAHDYVSYVDKESERRIVAQLRELLPEAGFIAEEGSGSLTTENYCWLVDPLDGTTNFIHNNAPYCVSIALRSKEELLENGVDVQIGYVETHGRVGTEAMLQGLPVISRRKIFYKGKELEEMDLDTIIRIHPEIVIVDELAHTNVEGSLNEKRWQDVMALLDEGINVISAINIQHIESVNEEVQEITGIEVKERVPDSVLQEADEVVNIDLTAEELIARLKAGKIYRPEKIQTALDNFFRTENILQLRELALKEVALRVEKKVENEVVMGVAVGLRHEKFMACISSHEKTPRRIIRKAAKLATRYNTTFIALYVQTPKESMDRIGLARQRYLLNHFKLVTELGGEVVQVQSRDILGSIVEICKEKQISTVCMGSPDLKLPYAICSILGYRKFLNNLSRANVDLIILA